MKSKMAKSVGEIAYKCYRRHYHGPAYDDLTRAMKFAWENIGKSIREECRGRRI